MRHFRADTGEGGKAGKGIGNFAGELIPEDDGGFFDVLGFTVVKADLPKNYVKQISQWSY